MNTINRAMQYTHINWTKEQKQLLGDCFSKLDELLLTIQREGDEQKLYAVGCAHQTLHDINLDLGLREMAADIRKKYNVNELRD